MRFHAYVQWIAYSQWRAVREHAEAQGVALMGDVPVGVSSAAQMSGATRTSSISNDRSAPPEKAFKSDPFTAKWGQNWGFPLYNWERMAEDNFRLVAKAPQAPHEHLPFAARGPRSGSSGFTASRGRRRTTRNLRTLRPAR